MHIELHDPARGGLGDGRTDDDAFGDGLFDPPPLTAAQRAELLRSLAAGHAPQKACADAGVDPQTYIQALEDDAAFAVALGRLEAVRSLNVLSVTYQKAIAGAAADRSLYLKFRPPPPAPAAGGDAAEVVDAGADAAALTDDRIADLVGDPDGKGADR